MKPRVSSLFPFALHFGHLHAFLQCKMDVEPFQVHLVPSVLCE